MPKRYGNLFDQCFSLDSLYSAYIQARKGKRSKGPVMRFEDNLGAELKKLEKELQEGTYLPEPCRHFSVKDRRKTRYISAPSFRDEVVQHAIYAVIYPIFDVTFIHDSYGCRIAKGTHGASNKAQQFLRESPSDSFVLQMDIRKFYYRIVHSILWNLISKKIKDKRLIEVMVMFGGHVSLAGIPPGNLLTQIYALIYLDPLDQFVKRELKQERYIRYVDDFVIFGLQSREHATHLLKKIKEFLEATLRLDLSKYTIAPSSRGVNFVGFRTWKRTKFIRRHSLHNFSKSMKRENVESMVSSLGNARHSASHKHLCRRICENVPDLIFAFPPKHRIYLKSLLDNLP